MGPGQHVGGCRFTLVFLYRRGYWRQIRGQVFEAIGSRNLNIFHTFDDFAPGTVVLDRVREGGARDDAVTVEYTFVVVDLEGSRMVDFDAFMPGRQV